MVKIIEILSIFLLIALVSSQLTQLTTLTDKDASVTDDLVTTANGGFLIHSKSTSIYKIYDLDTGEETTAAENNGIYPLTMVPNTNKIMTIESDSEIILYTLPNLTEETITPDSNLDIIYATGKNFFNDDGSTLYIVGDTTMQTVDFSGSDYTVSALKNFSSICSSLNTSSLIQSFPYPKGNKFIQIDGDNNTCVVDYSDLDNLTAEEGSHTEDAGTLTAFGILEAEKSIETNKNDLSKADVYDLLTGDIVFTYTFGTTGAGGVYNGHRGRYWCGHHIESDEFIVVDAENLCKYQMTDVGFDNWGKDYKSLINYNTLIVVEDDGSKIYTFDIGSTWQDMDQCTSTTAQLGTLASENSNLLQFSMVIALYIFSVFL